MNALNQAQTVQEIAKYRVSIKRELRRLGCTTFHNEEATELLEAKLKEVKAMRSAQPMSATQKMSKLAEIYNPIRQQVEKEITRLTLDQLTALMKAEGCTLRSDLVATLAKRRAIPLYKLAGLT